MTNLTKRIPGAKRQHLFEGDKQTPVCGTVGAHDDWYVVAGGTPSCLRCRNWQFDHDPLRLCRGCGFADHGLTEVEPDVWVHDRAECIEGALR